MSPIISGGAAGGGSGTVTNVSAADTSVVVANQTTTPTIRTNTLDVVATQHPPAAAVALNAQKITGLANGSAATDAAAFGQIPTALGETPRVASGRFTALARALSLSTETPTINVPEAFPFYIGRNTTFVTIGIEITTGGTAGSVVRLGMWNDAAGIPGTLLLDAGTVVATGTGIQNITINQAMTPGWYWAGATWQVAAPGAWRMNNTDSASDPRSSGLIISQFIVGAVLGPNTTTGAYGSFGTVGNGQEAAPRIIVGG